GLHTKCSPPQLAARPFRQMAGPCASQNHRGDRDERPIWRFLSVLPVPVRHFFEVLMPAKKSSTPVVSSAKKTASKASAAKATPEARIKKAPAVTTKPATKAVAKTTARSKAAPEELDTELTAESAPAKKKPGRPAKAAAGDKPAAKRG